MSKTQKIHKVVKQWLEHAEEDLRLAKHAFSEKKKGTGILSHGRK